MKLGYLCGDITRFIHRNDQDAITTSAFREAREEAMKAILKLNEESPCISGLMSEGNWESDLRVAFGLGAAVTGITMATVITIISKLKSK